MVGPEVRARLIVLVTLCLIPAALAQTPGELIDQADYAARIDRDYARAAELYRQALDKSNLSATESIQARFGLGEAYAQLGRDEDAAGVLESLLAEHPDRAGLVQRVNSVLAELIPIDPASLMPPDTIVYVELGSPGRQVETLLDWTSGSPLENPLAIVGMNAQARQASGGQKNPADVLAAMLNPSMLAEFKKLRGFAFGLTSLEGIQGDGAPFIAVLQPGGSDAIRGILQAALAMAGQPGDPIEEMTTFYNLGSDICAAHDDRVILLAKGPEMLAEVIRRYHGQVGRGSLASDNRLFGALDRQGRSGRVATAWFNGPALHAGLRRMLEAQGQIPPQFAIAEAFFGLAELEQGKAMLTLNPGNGIAVDVDLQFAPGHRCLALDMIRTPNLQPRAFAGVPADAVVLASFAIGEKNAALARQFDATAQRLTGLDIGRELFANLEQVTLFLLPPDPQLAPSVLSRRVSPAAPRFGLVLTSRDPVRTFALIEKYAQAFGTAAGYSLARHGDSRMLVGSLEGEPVYAWLDQQANATILAFHPAVQTAMLSAAAQNSGVLAAGPLHDPVAALPGDASKAVLVNAGGAIRLAASHALAQNDGDSEATQQWAQACENLAKACDAMHVELYTRESPNTFAVHAQLRNLPSLATLFPLIMQVQSGPPQSRQAAVRQAPRPKPLRAIRPIPAPGASVSPAGPTELAWQPGRNAQHSIVHLGESQDNLDSLIPGVQIAGNSFSPASAESAWPDFQAGKTYCWRVDSVRPDGSTTQGIVWQFTTDGSEVGWWKLDEPEGAVALDSSSFGRHGELAGGPQWRPDGGIRGGALYFDGADDAVVVPGFEFEGSSATFTAWINGRKAGGWAGIVFSRSPDQPGGIHFGDDDHLHYTWNNDDPRTYSWQGPAITPGQWNFVAVAIDPQRATAYVATPDGTVTKAVNSIDHQVQSLRGLTIGWDPLGETRRFAGLIDEVRIYDYALGEAQIRVLAAHPLPGPVAAP